MPKKQDKNRNQGAKKAECKAEAAQTPTACIPVPRATPDNIIERRTINQQFNGNIGFLYKHRLFAQIDNHRMIDRIEDGNLTADSSVKNVIQTAKWGGMGLKARCIYECIKVDVTLRLTLLYPGLYVGMGYTQGVSETQRDDDLKNGMSFDYTTGLPYIPGSEVKGMLRNSFINHPTDTLDALRNITKNRNLTKDDLLALECAIFGNRIKGGSEDTAPDEQGTVIFYDAFPLEGRMDTDSITPHRKKSSGSNIPSELQEPNPIKTLKVAAGSIFKFQFRVPEPLQFGMYTISRADIRELFKQLILDWGMGAKTNVGYGTFQQEQE